MAFWKTQHFKALQAAWYKRLEEEGFDDAEEMVGGKMVLKQTALRGAAEVVMISNEAYYNFVSRKVKETVFSREIDRLILERHAEGARPFEIMNDLIELGYNPCRTTVRVRIRVFETKWGIRQYTRKQLNLRVS